MDLLTKVHIKHGLGKMPKAKPLAEMLVEEAVRQGATLGEFKLAVEIASVILAKVMDPDLLLVDGFKGETEAAFKSI